MLLSPLCDMCRLGQCAISCRLYGVYFCQMFLLTPHHTRLLDLSSRLQTCPCRYTSVDIPLPFPLRPTPPPPLITLSPFPPPLPLPTPPPMIPAIPVAPRHTLAPVPLPISPSPTLAIPSLFATFLLFVLLFIMSSLAIINTPPPVTHIRILHLPIPRRQPLRGTPQPAPQLMQEQPGVLPSQKIGQQPLCVTCAGTALDIDCLEDGDNVLEEEFRIVGSACGGGRCVG